MQEDISFSQFISPFELHGLKFPKEYVLELFSTIFHTVENECDRINTETGEVPTMYRINVTAYYDRKGVEDGKHSGEEGASK